MNGQVTFEGLLKLLKKNVHLLIWWMIGCFIIVAVFTVYLVEPQYQSSSRIVVNQTESNTNNLTSTDISTNISLINTYQSIIMEPIILGDVLEQTGSNDSLGELREKIDFQTEEESLVFGIVVTDNHPQTAADLANTTSEIFQEKISDILPVESVTILSEAVPNSNPVSPNIIQNLLFGILLGLFIGLLQLFMTTLLDKRVKSSEIITDLGWINLGSVNEMSPREVKETVLPVQAQPEDDLSAKNNLQLSHKRLEG